MYIGSLRILVKFTTEYLLESVSSTYLGVNSDETSPSNQVDGGVPTLLSNGAGYVMEDGKYLLGTGVASNGYKTNITDQITIGFWLYPINHGLATSSTGNVESITMPLLSLADTSSYSPTINFKEHTDENNENYMTVEFNGGAYTITSENYTAGMWHHIWVYGNKTSGNFAIYIDGKIANASLSGDSSTTVGTSNMDLYINYSNDGYSYNIAKNYGYIDDIFVLNESNATAKDIQTVINNGIDYLVDTNLRNKIVDGYNVYFNDPTTITVNSIVDDMSYIYLGRNDGKILRGSPLFWQTRKDFTNENEASHLDLTLEEASSNGIINGSLKLTNTTIRL